MFRVVDASSVEGRQQWLTLWSSWPEREVFAHPNYGDLFRNPAQRLLCATWESELGFVLYPFILRDLSKEAYFPSNSGAAFDIVTPYGYGGAFCWSAGDRSRLSQAFWAAFAAWTSENRVVSEFVRLSLRPQSILEYPGTTEERLQNVVCDLSVSEDTQWMEFEHKVRKNVRKAQNSRVSVEIDLNGARLSEFLTIYHNTMTRREAECGYFFEQAFFERICDSLPGQFAFFHAIRENVVISTELVLISARAIYSFLGGTEEAAFEFRPNDLLKYEVMRWGREQGKTEFVLGGGYSRDDGIFRYKRAFAPNGTVPFHVGFRVLDAERTEGLIASRLAYAQRNSQDWTPRPGFFPPYRS